jgi:hypothetical protein
MSRAKNLNTNIQSMTNNFRTNVSITKNSNTNDNVSQIILHYILITLNGANVRMKMVLELVLFRENVVVPFLFTNSFFQNKTQPRKRFG